LFVTIAFVLWHIISIILSRWYFFACLKFFPITYYLILRKSCCPQCTCKSLISNNHDKNVFFRLLYLLIAKMINNFLSYFASLHVFMKSTLINREGDKMQLQKRGTWGYDHCLVCLTELSNCMKTKDADLLLWGRLELTYIKIWDFVPIYCL
jgi:hypothetical protein